MRNRILRLLAAVALFAAIQAGIHPNPAEADDCRIEYCCPNEQLCAFRCGPILIDVVCL